MLVLPSFSLRNFRCFEHLDLPSLGEVTLVVGRNNVGKTTLLEAAALYARAAATDDIARLLSARGELDEDTRKRVTLKLERLTMRPEEPIELSAGGRALTLRMGRVRRVEEGRWEAVERGATEGAEDEDALLVQPPNGRARHLRRSLALDDALAKTPVKGVAPCWFIPSHGLDDEEIAELVNAIALTPHEQDAVRALSAIVSGVHRVQIIEFGAEKVPMAGTAQGRVPLRSFGDGVVRLYGVASAIAATRGGIVLIDEFEAGIHFSAMLDAWTLVFAMAREAEVQVIATTHNGDCVAAFRQAAIDAESAGTRGALVRLFQTTAGIRAQTYMGEMLRAAAREQVEVR